jgi:hypothetical protein
MNITEFLEARIAEDEAEAGSGWSTLGDTRWERDNYGRTMLTPSAVLAECAAKRAIIDLAKKASEFEKWYDDHEWQGTVESSEPLTGDAILYALAVIYKDHPDYRQEWEL